MKEVFPPQRKQPTRSKQLVDLLWLGLPLWEARYLPAHAAVLADGVWLTANPMVGIVAPPLAAMIGLVIGATHSGLWVSASILIPALLYAIALLSGKLGLWATCGYVVGDVLIKRSMAGTSNFLNPLLLAAAYLLAGALLSLLLVFIPMVVSAATGAVNRAWKDRKSKTLALIVTSFCTAGLLGWAWGESMAPLIRPLGIWTGRELSYTDVQPLQEQYWVLIGSGAASGIRVLLERRIRGPAARRAQAFALLFPLVSGSRTPRPLQKPGVAVFFLAVITAFLLSGMMSNPLDGAGAFLLFLCAGWGRLRLSRVSWWRLPARIPTMFRFLAGLGLTWLVARAVVPWALTNNPIFGSDSLRPLLISVTFGACITGLLTAPGPVGSEAPDLKNSGRWGSRVGLIVLMALLSVSSDSRPALADDCSGFSDCFYSVAAALLVIALLALLVAMLLTFLGPGGGLVLAGGGVLANGAVAAAATNAAASAAAAAFAAVAAGTILQMSSDGTPGSNQAQNKQFDDAVREAEKEIGRKLSKDEIRQAHDAISGQGYGYHEIVDEIIGMFGGG